MKIKLNLCKISDVKKSCFLFIFLIGFLWMNAQQIYVTDWKSDANVIVYVTDWKSDADLIVFKTDWKSDASKNEGIWYFTDWKSDAKKQIYFTDWKSDANVIIYFTDWKSDAGWKNSSKKHYFE